MKVLAVGLGVVLSSASMGGAVGGSSVSIGAVGDGVHIAVSGKTGTNRVNISGASIDVGNVSSIVGGNGARSEIQMGGHRDTAVGKLSCGNAEHSVHISGTGHSATIDGGETSALCVSGTDNDVTAQHEGLLRFISLSGVRNVVRVEATLQKLTLYLGGVGNTVYVPRQADVQVIRSGIRNTVIRF